MLLKDSINAPNPLPMKITKVIQNRQNNIGKLKGTTLFRMQLGAS